MKTKSLLVLAFILFATGCPPPDEPDPVIFNTIEFIHDIPSGIVTELRLGFGSPSTGYAFGANVADPFLTFGNTHTYMNLGDGFYQVKMKVLEGGVFLHERSLDIGEVLGGINVKINLSVLSN